MAEKITKDTRVKIVANVKNGTTIELITPAGHIKRILDEFMNPKNSLKHMMDDLVKKMDAYSDTAEALEKMSEADMN